MIRTLLKFHNLDSTLDLNDQLSGLFKRGIVNGGDVLSVAGQLAVDVTPFKLIGTDGMVVLETADTTRLSIPPGQTSIVVFKSQYVPNNEPIYGFEVLELSAYNSRIDKDYLTIFAVITLSISATEVLAANIDYNSRDVIDPVGRLNIRGVLNNETLLPTQNNRAGDAYFVTSGLGDTPALYCWNGSSWINLTDSLLVASLLQAHRSNLFSNEIHLTDEQAIAALGTAGNPGVEPIAVTINIGSSTFTLANPISNNSLVTGKVIQFLTSGALPAPMSASTDYYVIPLTATTFQIATTPANATSNTPILLGGVQSGTHTAVFEENKYVTSTDPRMANQDENDALKGYPSNPPPSATNPFVTAAYVFSEPTAKPLTATGGPIAMTLGDGPFYVGFGGAGTAKNYFKLYNASQPREYIDSVTQLDVQITNVFKDAALTQPLVPSSEPTVLSDNGFYTGALYLSISGSISDPSRLVYGKKSQLDQIDRNAFNRINVNSAQTSQEVILKFQELSGRLFDDITPTDEQNINLLVAINSLRRYLITSTAANLVVSRTEFKRMRTYPVYASEFAKDTNETVIVTGNKTYTVSTLPADVTAFDATITTPDTPFVAVITYNAPPTGLANTVAGYLFTDGAGERFRILNYNPANNDKVLIYTGGRGVSMLTSQDAGKVVAGNNPRQLELTYDHQTIFGEDYIQVLDVQEIQNESEELPPGGSAVGVGSTFTLIGTDLLPGQGSGTGSGGRLAYQILPKIQNNRYEDRVRLYGNWKSDQKNFPNQAIGDVSQGVCGIEYTGRINDLILYTNWTDGAPFNYRIFVDGVYASQKFASGLSESGIDDSAIDVDEYDSYQEVRPVQGKVSLGLNLSQDTIHTVRVEITSPGTVPFRLSGLGAAWGTSLLEERGRTFMGAAYNDIDTAANAAGLITDNRESTQKVVRYIDASGARNTVTLDQPYYSDANRTVISGAATFTISGISDLLFSSRVGDVLYMSSRFSAGSDLGSQAYKRIVSQTAGSRTIESSNTFGSAYVEYAYRIPVSPNTGAPVVSAPRSLFDKELTRLLVGDWTVGRDSDVGEMSLLSQESRTTVLVDGSTAIRVVDATRVNEDIEGYVEALALSQTTSEIQITAWCSRMDLVFCGNQGPVDVDLTIDGSYTYTISLKGDGVERHTVFYDGQLRTHSILINNPSQAGFVVLGETILHELADPSFNGVKVSEYNLLRNSNSKLFPDFAPIAETKSISNGGMRLYDILSSDVRLFGPTGVSIATDDVDNVFYSTSATLTQSTNGLAFDLFGSGFELYVDASAAPTNVTVTLNGLTLTTGNFPNAKILSPGANGFTVSSSGLQRLVCTDLPFGFYQVQVKGLDNPVKFLTLATNALIGQVSKRNLDDLKPNLLHFEHLKDWRSFLSLEPQQIGLVAGSEGTVTEQVEGSGEAEDLAPLPGYQAVVRDKFSAAPSSPTSKVDPTYTHAQHNFGRQIYSIKYYSDNTTGASGTLSSVSVFNQAPSGYIVAPGDIIYFVTNKTWRRITNVSGFGTTFDLDAPITVSGTQSVLVSQAVYTKDLVNLGDATEQNRLRDIFPSASNTQITIDYKDSSAQNDNIPDLIDTANVVVSASNSGLQSDTGLPLSDTFSGIYTRPVMPSEIPEYPLFANTDQERLFLVFFANPANGGSGSVNLIRYDANLYALDALNPGGILNSAFCYNDGSGTEINCLAPVNVTGSTEIELSFAYVMNAYPGLAESDLDVEVNGQLIPKFVLGTTDAGDLSFTELTTTRIRFSQDLITGVPRTSIRIRRKRGTSDLSNLNTNRLGMMADIWVGTTADVAGGYANYDTLSAAIASAQSGQAIRIRPNLTITENVTVNKRISIEGGGYDSFLSGTITCGTSCDYSMFRNLRCTQFIFNAGSDGNIVTGCFFTDAVSDSGMGNNISGCVQI